jgi:hypothetical protein
MLVSLLSKFNSSVVLLLILHSASHGAGAISLFKAVETVVARDSSALRISGTVCIP